jgi:cardiolipin synthase
VKLLVQPGDGVAAGVLVHALIAHTNRGGELGLRKLEMRLLAAGATVARTASDLTRYHAKYMIIDRSELHVLSFNFPLTIPISTSITAVLLD